MKIAVNIEDAGASDALLGLVATLEGSRLLDINRMGGEAAVIAARQYHTEFNDAGGWRGKRYFGGGGEGPGEFGSAIASAWFLGEASDDGATITNSHPHYALKVYGGTITPKRAGALTIPLIPEARGKMARDYTRETGKKLFTIPGANVLFEKGDSVSVKGWKGRKSKRQPLRAVYALVKSVTHLPWRGALPPEELILESFLVAWKDGLADALEDI